MRGDETHDRLSRTMMPGVDPKVIYRVNKAMDNPDRWSIYLNNQYMKKSGHGSAFDVLGLRGFLLLASLLCPCRQLGRCICCAVGRQGRQGDQDCSLRCTH
jgi:hypothetical protein